MNYTTEQLRDTLAEVAGILEREDPATDLYRSVCSWRDRLTGGSLFIWVAELKTKHFRFDAFGTSAVGAIDALRRGWVDHRAEHTTAADFEGFEPLIILRPIHIGRAYRDRIPL
jgi:hypothetical protein